jgi:DNA polymerase beta
MEKDTLKVKDGKDKKINTSKLESIPKVLASITRPSDIKGGSIYDLQLLHGIGEKSAIKLYENGVTLEGLISEWTELISKNPSNAILLPQKMERPTEYTQNKWNSLDIWTKNSILEINLKKKLDNETKQLCKIHKATLVGLKYFHDITQKIPREEIQKAEIILKRVAEYMNKDLQIILCGSYRRERDKSGDIDCCIFHPLIKTQEDIRSNQYNILANFVEMLINVEFIIDQLDMGLQKFMGLCMIKQNSKKTNVARRLDIRFMPYESYGSAILYFTGSANFNTDIRKYALNKGYSLSEFGFKKKSDGILIPCATEEDVFKFLNYPYKTPKERDI